MGSFIAIIGFLLTGLSLMLLSFFVQAALRNQQSAPHSGIGQHRAHHNSHILWALLLLALVYNSLLRYFQRLTGNSMLDGSIGAAIGLYICAHPAANAVNMLFFEQDLLRHLSEWSVVRWLALNLLVLLVGWMVLFSGIIRLV